MANTKIFRIFDTAKLSLDSMQSNIKDYINSVYNANDAELTAASPMMQILYVVASLGRMILYYIEAAMNETNISTAVHSRSIRGLATLTGHNPSSGMAARGAVKISYNRDTEMLGETITIANYSKITNMYTGLNYMLILPCDSIKYVVGDSDNELNFPIIQGEFRYQQGTGDGTLMQSYSFSGNIREIIDNYYVNVFVNGEQWKTTQSFLDLSYNEKACVVKTNQSNGIDVFFGNYNNGAIPPKGSTILIEYLISRGSAGNIAYVSAKESAMWSFVDKGLDDSKNQVDLNDIFTIAATTDVLFGRESESIQITRVLAPHASRSFVLANKTNYEYFLRKLNMFSTIDVIQGFNTFEDKETKIAYDIAERNYINAREEYLEQVKLTGEKSKKATEKYQLLLDADNELEKAKNAMENSKLDDNIVYILLVPKLENRINETSNYFTCNQDAFMLTDKEKQSIIDLIDDSGQRIITVDNQIIDPVTPRFAVNIFIQMWDTYSFDAVKDDIISAVSDYLTASTRRDRIPVSDFVALVEGVNGVDSVSIYFDADKNNETYYGEGNYGIDDFGDIILERTMKDTLGNEISINDMFPLFRGPFVSCNGVEYSDDITSISSVINIQLRGKTNSSLTNKLRINK